MPGFIVQYRQRVGGRLDQVIQDLAPFREIAERFHGGSLEALIRHHLISPDPTFRAEGAAIQAMVDAQLRLQGIMDALQGGVFQQMQYLVMHADRDLIQATWSSYVPAFTLDGQGILMALIIGVALWLLFLLVWKLLEALLANSSGRGSQGARKHRREPTLP